MEYRRVLANTVTVSLLQNGIESTAPVNSVTFQVTQQTPVPAITTVVFNLGGTATEGSDYQSTPHAVQIPANGTMATITLPIIDDRLIEGPESVVVQLQSASNPVDPTVMIDSANNTATGTIFDNDSASVSLVSGTVSVSEGGAAGGVQVQLALSSTGNGTEQLAVPVFANFPGNADYSTIPVSFGNGAINGATASIGVLAVDDRTVESSVETFGAEPLQATSSATVSASGTQSISITDNDSATVTMSPGTTSVTEGGATANISVSLALATSGNIGSPQLGVPVSVGLLGNSDFFISPGSFAAGSTDGATTTVGATAIDDLLVEATTESFPGLELKVFDAGGANVTVAATSGTRTIQVNDNDFATAIISNGTTSVTEGGGSANLPVTLSLTASGGAGGVPQLDVPIMLALPASADYSANTVTFNAGSVSGASDNFAITATDDLLIEAVAEVFLNQSLIPTSSASVIVSGTRTVAVNDNDTAQVSINSGSLTVTEGGPAKNVPVGLFLQASGTGGVPRLAVPISVNLPSSADYSATAGVFPIGSTHGTSVNVGIAAIDDTIVEPAVESAPNLMVFISDSGGALVSVAAFSGTQQIDVLDNDTATVSIAKTTDGSEQGPLNGVFTVTQTQISTVDTVVSYSTGGTATSGSDYVALSGSVTIPSGGTSATISVPVIDDPTTDPNETVVVTLTGIVAGNNGVTLDPVAANRTASLVITDNDNTTTIDLADASDTGVSNTDNITKVTTPTLNGTAPANASVVILDSGNNIGSTTASNGGIWSIVPAPLTEGVHNLVAQATLGPNVTTSPVLSVTIDTQTSTPLIAGINPDNGSSASDGITNVDAFLLNGTAEKNSSVDVFQVGTKLGTAIADAAGNWSFNVLGPLADGASVFYTVQSTDLAGNASAFSAPFNVHVDLQPPPAPTQPDLIPNSDNGISNSDNLTNVSTPTFTSGGEVGSTITLFEGGTLLGSGVVGGTGVATITTITLADGPHNIAAQSTDVAGNVSGPSTALTVTIDTVPPALSPLDLINSSDSGISNADNITNVAQPVVAGTADPGAMINILDGANVIAGTSAGPGGGFQTALPLLTNGAHNLSARTLDSAGNLATTPLLIVTIDTIPPATPSKPVLAAPSDSGASNSDQITNKTSVQLSGNSEPGATELIFDGPALIDIQTVDVAGLWQSSANLTTNGVHSITVLANDVAGNTSNTSPALAVTIDTFAPSSPLVTGIDPDTGASSTDGVTTATSFHVNGNAEANSSVTVFDGGAELGSVAANAAGAWSFNVIGPLTPGTTHFYTATATDLAGNVSAISGSFKVVIDSSGPTTPVITGITTDSGRSPSDGITNDQILTVSGTSDANDTISIFDGAALLGTTNAAADGAWSFVDSRTLLDGSAHSYKATASDTAGNTSGLSAPFIAKIDLTPPVAPVIFAVVTNIKGPADAVDCPDMNMDDPGDPAINLAGIAEPDAIVSVKDGGTLLGTAMADASGNWSFKDTRPVADGAFLQYSATATDVAGNTGPASPTFSPSVDRAAPSAPTIAGIAPDTGASATDGVTSATKIKLSGTAEGNALVAVYEDATVIAAVIAGANGSWSFSDFRTLADGSTHNYSATATDLSGNTGFRSTIFVVKIDTKPPGAPSAPDLTDGSDSGSSNTDNITSVTTPTFTGKAEPAATVRLVEGATVLGTGVADGAGNWTITSTALADGVHNVAARAVDLAGNVGPSSTSLAVTIDTVHPIVAFVTPSQPGDTDSDGDCDLQDLVNVLNHSGKSNIGDLNGDGFVDGQDRDIVANHLGESLPVFTPGIAQTAFAVAQSAPAISAAVMVESMVEVSPVAQFPAAEIAQLADAPFGRSSAAPESPRHDKAFSLIPLFGFDPAVGEIERFRFTEHASSAQAVWGNAQAIDRFFERTPMETDDLACQSWNAAAQGSAELQPCGAEEIEALADAVVGDLLSWQVDSWPR